MLSMPLQRRMFRLEFLVRSRHSLNPAIPIPFRPPSTTTTFSLSDPLFRIQANLLPLSQQVPLPSLRQHHPSWIDYYRTHKDNTGAGRNEVITPRPIPGQALTADSGTLKHTVDVLLAKRFDHR